METEARNVFVKVRPETPGLVGSGGRVGGGKKGRGREGGGLGEERCSV